MGRETRTYMVKKEKVIMNKDDIEIYLACIALKTEDLTWIDIEIDSCYDENDRQSMREQRQLMYVEREMLKDKIYELGDSKC